MKKFLLTLILLSTFVLSGQFAHAQTAQGSVQPGGKCTADADCADPNGQIYGCYPEGNGICTVDGDPPADGTVAPGGACTNDNSCTDVNGQIYGCSGGVCTPDGDPTTATGANASTQSTTGGAVTSGDNFVPLTNIPAIQDLAKSQSTNLSDFFNNLYKYCIGIAAALAVFKIIQAGIMYMGGDSVTETKQARSMIMTSILGLILVLSPAIVFGIINPNILSLQLGGSAGLSSLAPAIQAESSTTLPTGAAATCTATIANGAVLSTANDEACCNLQSGCKVTIAIPKGGDILSPGATTCACTSSGT